jgi:hypothetical protein
LDTTPSALSFLLPGYSLIWHTPAVRLHGLY